MNEHKIYVAMTLCNSTDRGKCKICPYHPPSRCTERMLKDAMQIIVRKDAKVDELQRKNYELEIELTAMRGAANSYKAECVRLRATVDAELDTVHNLGEDYERALEENNRQKTEIDILIRKKETLRDEIAEKQAEIERMKAESQMSDGYADALIERAKAEAYKEFVELFKTKAEAYTVVTPPDFTPETTYKIMESKLYRILSRLTKKGGAGE